MNLQRLWCLLVIMAFSSPVFAIDPNQIDSFDNFDPNWVEAGGQAGWGSYMEQVLVGAPNEVNEGAGSMKIDFTIYPAQGSAAKRDQPFRTFDPNLNLTNYKDLALTLWVWIADPNDTRPGTLDSRLTDIVLTDSNFVEYLPGSRPWPFYLGPLGKFAVQPVKNVGWNKVIAPLRNFLWTRDANDCIYPHPTKNCHVLGSKLDPNTEVLWNEIRQIALFTRTEGGNDAIYIDDMQFEWAPPEPNRPYRVASFDNIYDELWKEDHGANALMLQTPGGDANYTEGTGSMMLDFVNNGAQWDLTPKMPLIPALDFADGNDWAISLWVWGDITGAYGSLEDDAYLWEIHLFDNAGNKGNYRVRRQDFDAGTGWSKVTARIDEFLWEDTWSTGSFPNITAAQANLDAIVALDLWAMDYPNGGNNVYLDDLRVEAAVEALSEAVVYNADRGTITVDGNASDWAGLVDSDIIDFDLTDPSIKGQPTGDLHVQYRLAWDPNYLYILVEEQPGDDIATEANDVNWLMSGGLNEGGTRYDSLALSFDFTNNKLPGVDVHLSLYLVLGLRSADHNSPNDLMGASGKTQRGVHYPPLIANGSVATSGTWGDANRVVEAKLKWTDLDNEIDSWFKPAGGIAAAVQAGYIFGSDPRLHDRENNSVGGWDASHGTGWFSGSDNPIGWPQGNYRWPTGRDKYSTDIRLVCSAGDLDFDCDVDFADYAQLAKEVYNTDCNSVNDFCDGADIVTPMDGEVDLEDVGEFFLRWLE